MVGARRVVLMLLGVAVAGACSSPSPMGDGPPDAAELAPDAGGVCGGQPDGTACDDGDACTQNDTCREGTCDGTAVTCMAIDSCHDVGVCDPASGTCSNPVKADGAACSDGDSCTHDDTCTAGTCAGVVTTCPATGACQMEGTCDPSTGLCVNPDQPDGTACDDADACTQTDRCQGGTCSGTNPVVCGALGQCHQLGSCDTATGLCSNPIQPNGTACNDGSAATQTDQCQDGTCVGGDPVACPATDQCHLPGTPDLVTGVCSNPPRVNGAACNDGNSCTHADTCQAGTCTGGNPVVCMAQDQCHDAGTCNPATGVCSNPNKADGAACTLPNASASCDGGVCEITSCDGGYDECNGQSTDGCEPIDTESDCGACGTTCHASASCGGTECACDTGYAGDGIVCTSAPSCAGLAATCGPGGDRNCCESLLVPGGTFNRANNAAYPATVADFRLDRYEVTVGRFRAFVNAGQGTEANPPAEGAGAHPLIPNSGWKASWTPSLRANTTNLRIAIKCDSSFPHWTDAPGANESKPMNCISFYEAFAFCAWDGGRLATEAELSYAAAGGNEQRVYPWASPPGSTTITLSHAAYSNSVFFRVGAKSPLGDGRWGHSDLSGNVWEWTLDYGATPPPTPCVNCANLNTAAGRIVRGGDAGDPAADLLTTYRRSWPPTDHENSIGIRCVR